MRGSDKIYVEYGGRRIEARVNHFQACEECGHEVMVVNLPAATGKCRASSRTTRSAT